ncbi:MULTISPECIES: hypothetical protein [Sellimonas]|nr:MULTISPECIES: hypothetical protein [Sellimonas]
MKKERRSRKQIKYDIKLQYYKMETSVSEKAAEIFRRKPYSSLR